jgi:hypothetical protein
MLAPYTLALLHHVPYEAFREPFAQNLVYEQLGRRASAPSSRNRFAARAMQQRHAAEQAHTAQQDIGVLSVAHCTWARCLVLTLAAASNKRLLLQRMLGVCMAPVGFGCSSLYGGLQPFLVALALAQLAYRRRRKWWGKFLLPSFHERGR